MRNDGQLSLFPAMDCHILVGDCASLDWVRRLRVYGWGRVFIENIRTPYEGERWMLDNGAYRYWLRGQPFPEDAFRSRLERALAREPRPTFAILPDKVGAGLRSLEYSMKWRKEVPDSLPWYLPLQDGMSEQDLLPHLPRLAGLFLGGTDKFKQEAGRWRDFAHLHGLPIHYGRAGTPAKFKAAISLGFDSLDSAFPLWTQERFERFIYLWLGGEVRNFYYTRPAPEQMSLF